MTNTKGRVLLIHRFFKPDSPPYAIILEDIREFLTSCGFTVDVLSSKPSYKSVDKLKNEKLLTRQNDGSSVIRLPVFTFSDLKISKAFNYIWFPLLSFCVVMLGKRYQVISVSTAPPVLLAFVVALAVKIRGGKLIYHCMDIHPEIGKISGEFKNALIYRMLIWMDNYSCRVANKIIVLSSEMKFSLVKREKEFGEKIEIINNYDLDDSSVSSDYKFARKANFKRVVFAGNIGRFQNLENFIYALKNKDKIPYFELVFVGEGAALQGLKEIAEGLKTIVKFYPQQSIYEAKKIISESDMAIISLKDKVINYAYPSKTMTYLSMGTPVLVTLDRQSELACFISDNKLGVILEPNDTNAIYDCFKGIARGEISFNKDEIKNVFERNYSKKQFYIRFGKLIDDMGICA